VVLQVLLFGAIAGSRLTGIRWPRGDRALLDVIGIVLAISGVGLFAVARVALGKSFTPLPRPRARGEFRDGGPYRVVRHPIYVAVVLVALGWSIARSPIGLIPTAVLAALFDLKARREEEWLVERYPDYAAYRGRTRRFLPALY
jgi:protein-S-isoprenylcysteine O-methyltransferase Ste14